MDGFTSDQSSPDYYRRAVYNNEIGKIQANPGAYSPNERASYLGNTYGSFVSPQEYIGALEGIYGSGSSWDQPGASTYGGSDPYAQWGGQGRYNELVGGVQSGLGQTRTSAGDRIGSSLRNLGGGVTQALQGFTGKQEDLNRQGVQNELARKQGQTGVLGMVGRGIRSGNVTLAGRNAGDSSAAGQLAGAYSDLGRRELGKVGQQYELGNYNLSEAQRRLGQEQQAYTSNVDLERQNEIDNIVGTVQQQLAQLDSQRLGLSLPQQFDVEAEKQGIKQQAIQRLMALDAQLAQGLGGIRPSSVEDRRLKAQELATAGTAPENSFDFAQAAPPVGGATNVNPFNNLPIYTRPRRDEV